MPWRPPRRRRFPVATDKYGNLLVDGGMLANDPALLAMVEATMKLGWPPDEVSILSLGTTRTKFPKPKRFSFLGWAGAVADIFMAGQAWTTEGMLKLVKRDGYYRVNPDVGIGQYSLDRVSQIGDLIALGQRESERHADRVAGYCSGPRREWQSVA
ncbi:MAG: hypothetical protein H0W41_06880 [Chloroflexi bacterium]|nr:hypothetical protein [Chloroflexota bacterium]